ncbi:MAG: hypothetical protein DMG16_12890 [Acidobacteria bacterium]|nr:MAG: hypothetical protein DMG16_12890 [Acidobacteriota bacterium]
MRRLAVATFSLTVLIACRAPQPSNEHTRQLTRDDFNRRAAEKFLPLFWREDTNKDGMIQPNELAILWGYGDSETSHWIDAQQHFTPQFDEAYRPMLEPDPPAPNHAEEERHKLVLDELAQGRPTLVETDLSRETPETVNAVRHLMNAARAIERIYAKQRGVFALETKIPAADTGSRMLLYRNQSPFCEGPRTEKNPACSALQMKPARIFGLYPAEIQGDTQFCETLAKAPNAQDLMGHFNIVMNGDQGGTFKIVPYNEAYKNDMQAVASELEAAAASLGPDEAAFKAYLLADAQSFRTNDWEPANRAWVAMSAENSHWYARVAPDEVYYEPCAWKAGFALQLARINPDSLAWRRKLDPLKNEMESVLSAMAGAPYKARNVQFKVPDFIDVVLNAADQRPATGATIGQSLPNWGPVAEAGGRTVAMTNLYTDADSQTQLAMQMSSLFCKATNVKAATGREESLIGSLLHEVAHNLGPAHEYKVNGQVDTVAFGGPLASMLEELKAQTSSMFLTDWLMMKGFFTQEEVDQINLRNIAWAFGHISRGMYTVEGTPRTYSQLAAIQVGSFTKSGAIDWKSSEVAANGTDSGCLEINFDKMPAAIRSLETTVLKIKATGDRTGAENLKAEFVDRNNDFGKIKTVITERWLRAPKATFVYSLKF